MKKSALQTSLKREGNGASPRQPVRSSRFGAVREERNVSSPLPDG